MDTFNNRAGTVASFGYGWTSDHDIAFLPFAGPQKRLVLPGGRFVNMVDDGQGGFRPAGDPRMAGSVARAVAGGRWEVSLPGGTRWTFEPFPGTEGPIRGGAPSFLTRITDRNGRVTELTRQSNGRLLSIQGEGGRRVSLSYGVQGFVDQLTDHTGRTQRYAYTDTNRIRRITDAQGGITEYTYKKPPVYANEYVFCSSSDSSGQCTRYYVRRVEACPESLPQDHEGLATIRYPWSETPTVNTYGTDRVLRQVTARGETWRFAYRRLGACVVKLLDKPLDSLTVRETFAFTCRAGQALPQGGRCPEVDSEATHAAGWRFYGGSNVETRVVQPDGGERVLRFNERGLVTWESDALGQVTRHAYDARQRLVSTTDALGRVTRHEYDNQDRRTATVDPMGRRSEVRWDAASSQIAGTTRYLLGVPSTQGGQVLDHTPVHTSRSYDGRGNLASALEPDGTLLRMSHDERGRLARIVLPVRASATELPVLQDGVAATVPASRRTLSFTYTDAGDLASVTDALGHRTLVEHDALGRPIAHTDPLGFTSRTRYDRMDRPTVLTDPLGQDSALRHDAAGRLQAVVNAAGVAVETYTHDRHGRVVATTDALGRSSQLEYDAAGRVTRSTDRMGQVSQVHYDLQGRPIRIERAGQDIQLQYDAAGRTSELRDATSVIAWRYDDADRPVQVATTTAAGTQVLRYAYDSLDRIVSRTLTGTGLAQAEVTRYEWDLAGRLLSHSTQFGSQANTAQTTRYEWDAAGRLAARHHLDASGPALTQRYAWDAADRLTRIRYIRAEGTASEQLIEQIDYGLDARGQRTSRSTLHGLGSGKSDTPMEATYDAGDQLVQLTVAGKTYSLHYDANGNMLERRNTADASDAVRYRWDAANRLIGIEQPGLQASFSYDALGRRVQASITREGKETATVQYVYEGLQALGEIRDGRMSHRLLTGLQLDEVIARIAMDSQGRPDANRSRMYLTDALNSVIAQMDQTGLANGYGYSPYGESQTFGVDPTGNPIQYTGRENDGAGVYYYRARYYNPVMGRFISRDPIGLAGGWNLYAYVGADPLSRTDPRGLYWFQQTWQANDPIVGRVDTVVPPGGPISSFIERYVPAGRTLAEIHDPLVEVLTRAGIPDLIANVPTMPAAYAAAIWLEILRSLGVASQPRPICR